MAMAVAIDEWSDKQIGLAIYLSVGLAEPHPNAAGIVNLVLHVRRRVGRATAMRYLPRAARLPWRVVWTQVSECIPPDRAIQLQRFHAGVQGNKWCCAVPFPLLRLSCGSCKISRAVIDHPRLGSREQAGWTRDGDPAIDVGRRGCRGSFDIHAEPSPYRRACCLP